MMLAGAGGLLDGSVDIWWKQGGIGFQPVDAAMTDTVLSMIPSPKTASLMRRVSLPLGFAAFGLLLVLSGYRFDDLSLWLQSTGNWAPLLFIVTGTLLMTMMMPKTMVSLAAGALFGTQDGCPIMLVTAVTAAALNYTIGKYWIGAGGYFYSNRSSLDPQRDVGEDRDASIEPPISWPRAAGQLAQDAGFGIHLLVRLSPVPTTIISYSMGAAGARFVPYVAAAAVAVVPQLLYVHAAAMAVDSEQSLHFRWISSVLSLSVATLVSLALPPIAIRRLKEIRGASLTETSGYADRT
jgi:uncharacterized membrane protein YdjX (TVP38/TMEM64 family)